jgi:hypothetical protein
VLQFIRKISGFHTRSKANEAAFDTAVSEVSTAPPRALFSAVHVLRPASAGEV